MLFNGEWISVHEQGWVFDVHIVAFLDGPPREIFLRASGPGVPGSGLANYLEDELPLKAEDLIDLEHVSNHRLAVLAVRRFRAETLRSVVLAGAKPKN